MFMTSTACTYGVWYTYVILICRTCPAGYIQQVLRKEKPMPLWSADYTVCTVLYMKYYKD